MKFRNPETGEMFDDIISAREPFCGQNICVVCPVPSSLKEHSLPYDARNCSEFCEKHPHEAARLMGYEVIREPGVDFPEPEYDPADVAFKGAEIDEEHTPTNEKTHADAIENACVQSKGVEIDQFNRPDQQAKADQGKPCPSLVPVSLIEAVTAIRMYGSQKYGDPENWRKVEPQRYRDALYRHWLAYLKGEKCDQESGLPHLWHLACNAAFLIEMEETDGR